MYLLLSVVPVMLTRLLVTLVQYTDVTGGLAVTLHFKVTELPTTTLYDVCSISTVGTETYIVILEEP